MYHAIQPSVFSAFSRVASSILTLLGPPCMRLRLVCSYCDLSSSSPLSSALLNGRTKALPLRQHSPAYERHRSPPPRRPGTIEATTLVPLTTKTSQAAPSPHFPPPSSVLPPPRPEPVARFSAVLLFFFFLSHCLPRKTDKKRSPKVRRELFRAIRTRARVV